MRSILKLAGADRSGAPARRDGQRFASAVAAVVVLALGLRLYRIGATSFWIDEINVLSFVRSHNLFSELRTRGGPFEPPLHYVSVWLATRLPIGFETAARLPAAVFGALEVLGLTLGARELTRRRDVAVIAGVFLAVAPFAVRYSQENRYYTTFSALHLLSWWLVLRAIRTRRTSHFVMWGVLAGLLLLAHPFSPLVVAVQVAVGLVAVRRAATAADRRGGAQLRRGVAVALGVALPWFLWGAIRWVPDLIDGKSYALNARPREAVGLDLDLAKRAAEWLLGNGARFTILVALLVALLISGLLVTRRPLRTPALLVGAYGFGFFVLIVPLTRVLNTYLAMRRIEFLLPPTLLIAAIGVVGLSDRLAGKQVRTRIFVAVFAGLVAALSVVGTFVYYASEKTAYREMAAIVGSARPSDLVVIGPVDERWPRSIRQYLGWRGVRHRVTFVVSGHRSPPLEVPKGRVLWITGAPPGRGFQTQGLNSLQDLQVVAGDRTAAAAILPWFVSETSPRTNRELQRELDQIEAVAVLLPPPASSAFPRWLFTGS